jgi:asparagine N-glycosylation enzyme membrane subunit Stt3
MAPAFSLLWALALVQVLGPFITIMKEVPVIPRRKTRLKAHVGKEFSAVFILMTFLLLLFTFVLPSPAATFPRFLSHAYSPTTIAAGGIPVKPVRGPVTDWIDTVNWMRANLPPSPPDGPTVVACWWDYGYWITVLANKTTLADNGTVNATQIARIGRMFMSNETEAIKILGEYGATYIVVFTTFDSGGNDVMWGDEGKWRWMAKIAELDDNSFGNFTLGVDWVDKNRDNQRQDNELVPNAKGNSTILYKLMTYGKDLTLQRTPRVRLEHFEKVYFSQDPTNRQEYGGVIPLVCVYKINYS